ncbi:MAG: 23S rRNA (guanosine(2251)-2'-O)-methyltransferase RlmB [Candidatus Competibacteraceae bacterium]|nr:23S rRNA (guanosine(2251)-2'-O)-methyltransferase RlmB [Candidatus Competibacteraceae bacterium]
MAEDLVYGLHAVAAALKYESNRVRALWVERQRRDARLRDLLETAAETIPVHCVERAELDRLSGGARHQGIVARLEARRPGLDEADLPGLLAAANEPALFLVLDGIQDPHNLGACLRSAAAAGVHAVIAPTDRAVGSECHRAQSGQRSGGDRTPFVTVTNLARTLRALRDQGVWIVGAAGEAEHRLYEVDFTLPTAIVLGGEEKGLRRLTREVCDRLARIPLAEGGVESLNVSVAAGIFLFEARRQRGLG